MVLWYLFLDKETRGNLTFWGLFSCFQNTFGFVRNTLVAGCRKLRIFCFTSVSFVEFQFLHGVTLSIHFRLHCVWLRGDLCKTRKAFAFLAIFCGKLSEKVS